MRETRVWFLGWEDPLEKEMAIHSSTLAWKIPWMEEPDRLQSMGSQRVRHDWATSLSLSLSETISRSIHVAANGIVSYFFESMYHILFIHPSVNGHLGYFCVFAIINSAAINIGVHASCTVMVFSKYMPTSGTAGSAAVLFIVFLRNLHAVLQPTSPPTV